MAFFYLSNIEIRITYSLVTEASAYHDSLYLTDISQSRAAGPTQPHLSIFPQTMQGDRKRSFKGEWYKQHPWLEYSHWKKAMFKDGGFKMHEKSEGHVNAMFAWGEHKKAALADSSIRDALNEAYNQKVQENRNYIKTVAEGTSFDCNTKHCTTRSP